MTITYKAIPTLAKVAAIAAARWNKALRHPVIVSAVSNIEADVSIIYGSVDRRNDFSRVAEYNRSGLIVLASDVKWSVTTWQRFWGTGQEDALAALLHEFGHALGLPHSYRESDVMHHTLGSTVISNDEAAHYRQFLKL